MMNPKTLLEKTREFEKKSRLADDKAKCDVLAKTGRRQFRVSGPLFDKECEQLDLPGAI